MLLCHAKTFKAFFAHVQNGVVCNIGVLVRLLQKNMHSTVMT